MTENFTDGVAGVVGYAVAEADGGALLEADGGETEEGRLPFFTVSNGNNPLALPVPRNILNRA